jgi:hypothetical protein
MRSLVVFAALLLAAGTARAGEAERWEGWIVGEPCAGGPQITDCPLRFVDRPVLLMEDGRHLAFVFGDVAAVKTADIDGAYGRKVRLQGALKDGVIVPVRLDVLEATGERKFFKGCL